MGDGQQGRIDIRAVSAEDYDALCEVIAEVDQFHMDALPHMFCNAPGPARTFDYIQDLINRADVGLFGAWVDDAMAGYVHSLVRPPMDFPFVVQRKMVLVDGLAVAKAFQRRGIARLLMERVEAFAKEIDADGLELKVYQFNQNAQAFYQSIGYDTYYQGMTKNLKNK